MSQSAKQLIAQRIEQLRAALHHHNYLYYTAAKPEISDREFDRLMHELIDLEKAHPEFASADSPTQRISGEATGAFAQVTHVVPMMSIDNTYDEAEVRAFDARVRKSLDGAEVQYVLEPKVDGVASSLRYENGALALAATRGNGAVGDDITANARTINSIPLRLHGKDVPDILEVRGEIFMPVAQFQKLNKEREAAGEETYKNPRNLTTGAIKQLDPKITASRGLRFVAHGLGQVQPLREARYWDWISNLKRWRLPVGEHVTFAKSIDEVIAAIEAFAAVRGTLAYQTDGMVVKVDSFAQRDTLGATSKAPRWVIAFKYASEQMPTVLKDVDWQAGKGGTLTPVARLEPILLGGTTVSNATLHNIEQIRRLDLHLGDTVVLEKAGEVIPYVRQAVPEKRPKGAKIVPQPEVCPSCGTPVEKDADSPYIRCNNPDCPAKFAEKLKWFCGRNQMDIENIGDALADQLVDKGLVKAFADLYRITAAQLLELERMGEKSAQNVIDAIAASRSRGLDRLLAGIGIRHVGNRVAFVLANNFGSLDALGAATVEQLSEVHEIGDVIAESVHEFFHSAHGKDVVHQFKAVGVNPKVEIARRDGPLLFEGQSIVVTGTLEHYKRPEVEALIVKHGGRASGSVSKKTAFVVAGADAGSKLDKARDLKVPVITEAAFIAKLKSAD
jgi:DNA ligase (NAD+)